MEILNLILENADSILQAIGAFFALIVMVLTIANKFMPDVITNETLAKAEFITSKFSIGTKKAKVIKK